MEYAAVYLLTYLCLFRQLYTGLNYKREFLFLSRFSFINITVHKTAGEGWGYLFNYSHLCTYLAAGRKPETFDSLKVRQCLVMVNWRCFFSYHSFPADTDNSKGKLGERRGPFLSDFINSNRSRTFRYQIDALHLRSLPHC